MSKKYDFSGWATKNDLLCADGRIIRQDAFAECDGKRVPLVWMHDHSDPTNTIGHADLENKAEGVYCRGVFNDTEKGKHCKSLVAHGDVSELSIWANALTQVGDDVLHGNIREVSLVLAGANPGARIENIIAHGEECEDMAIIRTGLPFDTGADNLDDTNDGTIQHSDENETVGDVLSTLNEKQAKVVSFLLSHNISDDEENENEHEDENNEDEEDEEETSMRHNAFDDAHNETENKDKNVLSHDALNEIAIDIKKCGSLKESAIAHGISNIETLFPEATNINRTPEFYKRDTNWVGVFMNGVHKTPFSRVKSMYANITADEARAKGYTKGKKKVEEVIAALKRSTLPTTIYKKQGIDRDDMVDITDFDVVLWLKGEMRIMIEEEIARAALIGDGRGRSDDDKINEQCIRPIWTDEDTYTIKTEIDSAKFTTEDDLAKQFIRTAIKSRKLYKGSGNTTLFTTEDWLTNCLLMEDKIGHRIYANENDLATAMRVKRIVTVPVMEGATRNSEMNTFELMGIIVDLNDYNIGADKGGALHMFDDFDIDYNRYKYLMETRCSGALVKPYSAIAIELKKPLVSPEAP